MPAVFQAFTADGRMSISNEYVPLKVYRRVHSISTVGNSTEPGLPLNNPTTTRYPVRGVYVPYNKESERRGIIFAKPTKVGAALVMSGVYNSSTHKTYYSVINPIDTNFDVDIALADLNPVPTDSKYISLYKSTGELSWSLDSLIKSVKVIATLPVTGVVTSYEIPLWADLSKVYVNVQHQYHFDNDNGTDPNYAVCRSAFQIVGRTLHFRVKYVYGSVSGSSFEQEIPTTSTLMIAYITDSDSNETVTSDKYLNT